MLVKEGPDRIVRSKHLSGTRINNHVTCFLRNVSIYLCPGHMLVDKSPQTMLTNNIDKCHQAFIFYWWNPTMGQLWCSKYGGNIFLGWVDRLFHESDKHNFNHETQTVTIRYNDTFFSQMGKNSIEDWYAVHCLHPVTCTGYYGD